MSMLNATNLDHMPFNWAPENCADPVPFSNQKPGVSVHTSPFRNRPLGQAAPTQRYPFGGCFFLGIFYLWVKKNRALQNRVKLVKVRCFSVRSNLPNIWCGDFGKIDPFSYRKKNPLRVSTNIAGRNIQHFDGIYQGQNFRCWEFKGKEWHSPLHLWILYPTYFKIRHYP